MTDPVPQPTLSEIGFPSDALTLGTFRHHRPDCFDLTVDHWDVEGPRNRLSLEAVLGGLIDCERDLVYMAFYRELGMNSPVKCGLDWDNAVEALTLDYQCTGIATGEHHAAELIRNLETQAVAQAVRYQRSR